jgi:competence protein CoiA
MEFALDYNGKRIDAWNKNEMISADAKYFCPSCGNPVIYRHGDIRIPHFAHESGKCDDEWNYDMSEWHSRIFCLPFCAALSS